MNNLGVLPSVEKSFLATFIPGLLVAVIPTFMIHVHTEIENKYALASIITIGAIFSGMLISWRSDWHIENLDIGYTKDMFKPKGFRDLWPIFYSFNTEKVKIKKINKFLNMLSAYKSLGYRGISYCHWIVVSVVLLALLLIQFFDIDFPYFCIIIAVSFSLCVFYDYLRMFSKYRRIQDAIKKRSRGNENTLTNLTNEWVKFLFCKNKKGFDYLDKLSNRILFFIATYLAFKILSFEILLCLIIQMIFGDVSIPLNWVALSIATSFSINLLARRLHIVACSSHHTFWRLVLIRKSL